LRESDEDCAYKCAALLKHGIRPLLCVGETEAERAHGATQTVVARQLESALSGIAAEHADEVDIAYEPVWAIGTGKTASPADARSVHAFIRSELVRLFGEGGKGIRILYGGSVTVETASSLIQEPEISGFLVGGASLKAQTFAKIIEIVAKFRQ
jgi:triosephosphate isomerase